MTVHTSQSSTFQNTFIDVGDIRWREPQKLLEMQRLLNATVTRSAVTTILVGT